MRLRYIGRQGSCRYWWRLFSQGVKCMYAKPDRGTLGPVAGSPFLPIEPEDEVRRKRRTPGV